MRTYGRTLLQFKKRSWSHIESTPGALQLVTDLGLNADHFKEQDEEAEDSQPLGAVEDQAGAQPPLQDEAESHGESREGAAW